MKTVYTIGIDFGTSNSCVAFATYLDRGNGQVDGEPLHRPEAISFHNRETIPTVVFLGDGQNQPPLFGIPAEEKAAYYPELTRSGFKLGLGHPRHGREAFLLAKQFLLHLRQRVAEFVPLDRSDRPEGSERKDASIRIETVVGHPVQWTADQREETRRAVQEAGFPNVRLEEESLAALYSHLCDDRDHFNPKPGSRILVVDMGGGTTDFAFLQLAMSPESRPLSIPVDPSGSVPAWGNGRRSYGGRDLDQLLLDYLCRDWEPDVVSRNRQALLREVRRFKEAFSDRMHQGGNEHSTLWLVDDHACEVRLTRAEFEEVACEYIAHFETLVRGALAEARLAPRQINYLILTGGHSRWYFVDEILARVLPHISHENGSIRRHSHPEQSVARGLAYDTLVRSSVARIMEPVRRAAHAVWVSVPNGQLTGLNGRGGAAWDEPILLVPRGQQLPFQTRQPLRIRVEQLGLDAREASVRVRFFSGQKKQALGERVARFERGLWEQLSKTLTTWLPWKRSGITPDQFEVLVACRVDEHELITAEVLITRLVHGKPQEVQREKLQLNIAAA